MAEFKLPDPKKTSGKVLGFGLLVGLGLVVWKFLLPFLLSIVWGTVELAIGAVVLAVLGYILLNPTFWKRTRIILDTLGEILFKGFVEMNPFTILDLQLSKTEKDIADLGKQAENLKAQEDRLTQELAAEEKSMQLSNEKINILKSKLRGGVEDTDSQLELESATNDWTNSKSYIDSVTPVKNDISRLVQFADKAYRKAGYALKDARNTIKVQRRTWEAVTTGSNAMKKAMRAFTGDPEMNKAGAIALEALKKDISAKVGVIKNSIQVTSQLMNQRDLNDAAKVSLALQQAENIDLGKLEIQMPERIPVTTASGVGNKYLKQLTN